MPAITKRTIPSSDVLILKDNASGLYPEAGVDEAGRGALAGPVVAAAVVLPVGARFDGLRDSKKLSPAQRSALREQILIHCECWNPGAVSAADIDRTNILQASLAAMREAVEGLAIPPAAVAVDGKFVFAHSVAVVPVVKGDDRYLHIAAASVLAKTLRDDVMLLLDQLHPQYGWRENKGYPTAQHLAAIQKYGLTPFHRRSFRPCAPTLFRAEPQAT
jgi:ribonuclease HII